MTLHLGVWRPQDPILGPPQIWGPPPDLGIGPQMDPFGPHLRTIGIMCGHPLFHHVCHLIYSPYTYALNGHNPHMIPYVLYDHFGAPLYA